MCSKNHISVGLVTGQNGQEHLVCKYCDIDGSNYNGWNDESFGYCQLCRKYECENGIWDKYPEQVPLHIHIDSCKKAGCLHPAFY